MNLAVCRSHWNCRDFASRILVNYFFPKILHTVKSCSEKEEEEQKKFIGQPRWRKRWSLTPAIPVRNALYRREHEFIFHSHFINILLINFLLKYSKKSIAPPITMRNNDSLRLTLNECINLIFIPILDVLHKTKCQKSQEATTTKKATSKMIITECVLWTTTKKSIRITHNNLYGRS